MNERNDMQAKLGTADRRHTILIIGISRGIGRGLAAEYLRRGWFVIGTVRSSTVAPELEAVAAGIQTDLGGSDAPVTVERVVPRIIDTIDSHRSAGGLHFVNAENEVVPW